MFAAIESLLYIEQTKQKGNHGAFLAFFHLYSVSHCVSPEVCDLFPQWLCKRSSLMFGHGVSSLHHRHAVPTAQVLLQDDVHEELCHNRTVLGCHPTPRPVIGNPGIGQALPHHRAMTWRGQHNTYNSQKCGIKHDFKSLLCSVIFIILKYYLILNPTPPTCVDLFEGATGPDVVQAVWTLRGASADVRKDGRCEEGGQFFFPQALHLRAVGSHAKVTQHQQLSLTYNSNTNREILRGCWRHFWLHLCPQPLLISLLALEHTVIVNTQHKHTTIKTMIPPDSTMELADTDTEQIRGSCKSDPCNDAQSIMLKQTFESFLDTRAQSVSLEFVTSVFSFMFSRRWCCCQVQIDQCELRRSNLVTENIGWDLSFKWSKVYILCVIHLAEMKETTYLVQLRLWQNIWG